MQEIHPVAIWEAHNWPCGCVSTGSLLVLLCPEALRLAETANDTRQTIKVWEDRNGQLVGMSEAGKGFIAHYKTQRQTVTG